MTRRYGIGILFCTCVMCMLYVLSYQNYERKLEESEQTTEDVEVRSVSAGRDKRVGAYYLKEEKGYICVYRADGDVLFERTSIWMKDLPEELQKEIRQQKSLENEEELYNFLENYSS